MVRKWLDRVRANLNKRVTVSFGVLGPVQPFDRDAVSAPGGVVSLKDLRRFEGGRFNVDVRGGRYEAFLAPSTTRRLFVFLAAAGRTTSETQFSRISWYPALNGMCLYIDDPMYKRHVGLSGGWYYGDQKKTYLHGIIAIVRKVAAAKGVHPSNIIFIGSSASAYASLYAADKIAGSVALAFNPQIRIRDWPAIRELATAAGIDPASKDRFGRNCLRRIVKNTKSRFFIATNMASHHDWPLQIEPWLKKLGEVPKEAGVVQHGNVHFLLHHIPVLRPHHTFLFVEQTIVLLTLLLGGREPDHAAAAAFYSSFSAASIRSDKVSLMRAWAEVLGRPLHPAVVKPLFSDKVHCKLRIAGLPPNWHYKLRMEASRTQVSIALLIGDPVVAADDKALQTLKSCSTGARYKVKAGRRLEMTVNKVPIDQVHDVLCDLVGRTVDPVRGLYLRQQEAA